jgi:hypothetical protein
VIFVLKLLGYRRLWHALLRIFMVVRALVKAALTLGAFAVLLAFGVKAWPTIQRLIIDRHPPAPFETSDGSLGLHPTSGLADQKATFPRNP